LQDADLNLLLETVKQAGDIALRFHGKHPRNWTKPDGTHVSEADIAVDNFLRDKITRAYPDDGWLSEETPDNTDRLYRRRLWIVDPIDGTRLFLAGEHGWGIGVALVADSKPVLSAIYCPSQKKMFHAIANQGAYLNDERLGNRSTSNRVITSKNLAPALAARGLEWMSGSGLPLLLRFAAIAEGSLAGATSMGAKNDWDIAAGHLILNEAGGVTTNAYGGGISYNNEVPQQSGVVAATSAHHAAVLECVGSH
jgi:myo-inositol-1(or 4)-monophosphatase